MVYGEVVDTTLDASGMLWYKERLCVPLVGDLIYDILSEAYDLCYFIHPVWLRCTVILG